MEREVLEMEIHRQQPYHNIEFHHSYRHHYRHNQN